MREPILPPLESPTAQRFLLGLRLAAVVIAAVILVTLSLPNLIRSLPLYRPPWVQIASFSVYTIVVCLAAIVIIRKQPWGWIRWTALAATVAACVASDLALGAGHANTIADWSYGTVGWVGVIVLTGRPLIESIGFLTLIELITLATVLADHPNHSVLLWAATSAISCIGFPLCGAIAVPALCFIASAAEDAGHQAEQIRTAEAVADGLHERRRQRFAGLYDTAVPLLQGLASGVLSPRDDQVQRRCAIEAARMRRLFAEMDTVPNPLLHELRHCADVADRKGILVEMEGRGQWPEPPLEIRRALTEAPLAALATATSWARVTVIGTAELLSVNVVADCGPIDLPHPAHTTGVRLQTIAHHDTLWVEVQWTADPSPR